MSRKERRTRLEVERLEDRATPSSMDAGCSGFGQAVAYNAQHPEEAYGTANAGQAASAAAQTYGGLGAFNQNGGINKSAFC